MKIIGVERNEGWDELRKKLSDVSDVCGYNKETQIHVDHSDGANTGKLL